MRNNNGLRKIMVFAVLMGFVLAAGHVFAEDTLVGTVMQTENGFMLQLEDGVLVAVDGDLSDMVGKKVKITGTLQEGETSKSIIASEIVEITE